MEIKKIKYKMNIFNYIFYRVAKFYALGIEKKEPEIYAWGITSAVQWIYFYIIFRSIFESIENKAIFLSIAFSILILNRIFFFKKKILIVL